MPTLVTWSVLPINMVKCVAIDLYFLSAGRGAEETGRTGSSEAT